MEKQIISRAQFEKHNLNTMQKTIYNGFQGTHLRGAHDPHKRPSSQVRPVVTTVSLRGNLSLSILDFLDAHHAP